MEITEKHLIMLSNLYRRLCNAEVLSKTDEDVLDKLLQIALHSPKLADQLNKIEEEVCKSQS